MTTDADDVISDDAPAPRRGLRKGQRHAGSFAPGFDPRRRGYFYDGKSFSQMAAEHAPECLDLWVRAVSDENAPWPIRIRASELIVERAYGKAASVIDMQVTHNKPLTSMTDEELLRILDAEMDRPALTIDADQVDNLVNQLAVDLAVEPDETEDSP